MHSVKILFRLREYAGWPGAEFIKIFFMLNSVEHEICSAYKSQITNYSKFFPVKVKLAEHEILSDDKCKNANYCWHFHIYLQRKFHAQLSWAWNEFYNLGARFFARLIWPRLCSITLWLVYRFGTTRRFDNLSLGNSVSCVWAHVFFLYLWPSGPLIKATAYS